MSDLIERLRADFQDEEYRHAYAEECLHTMIATQIKVLREQRDMTQGKLAEKTGMKQPRLSVMEDANYSNWSLNTLKRLARAFDVALTVRFDAFSDVILDFESLNRETLERPSFASDPLFRSNRVLTSRKFRFRRHRRQHISQAEQAMQGQRNLFSGELLPLPIRPTNQQQTAIGRQANMAPLIAAQQGGVSNAIGVSAAG